jgi:hypothetical protein
MRRRSGKVFRAATLAPFLETAIFCVADIMLDIHGILKVSNLGGLALY